MDHLEALREYLMFVVGGLVKHPVNASLVVKQGRRGDTLYEIVVDPRDYPRVIGQQGRMVSAIRSLLEAAAKKHGIRVSLRIDAAKEVIESGT